MLAKIKKFKFKNIFFTTFLLSQEPLDQYKASLHSFDYISIP